MKLRFPLLKINLIQWALSIQLNIKGLNRVLKAKLKFNNFTCTSGLGPCWSDVDSSVTVDTGRPQPSQGGMGGIFVTIWAGSRLIYGQLHLAWNIFIRVQVPGDRGEKIKPPRHVFIKCTKPSSTRRTRATVVFRNVEMSFSVVWKLNHVRKNKIT